MLLTGAVDRAGAALKAKTGAIAREDGTYQRIYDRWFGTGRAKRRIMARGGRRGS